MASEPSSSAADPADVPAYLERLKLRCPPFGNQQEDQFFFAEPGTMRRLDLLQHLTQFSDLLPIVTGPTGSGKTTLLHELRRQAGDTWRIGYLDGAAINNPEQLFAGLAGCFGMDAGQDSGDLTNRLLSHWDFQERSGHTPVLLVDDAHEMAPDAMEMLLHLARTLKDTLARVRIVFFGDTGLPDLITQQVLRDPKEAVLLHAQELPAFDEEQTATYLAFRLAVAGYTGESPFSATEVRDIQQASGGLPARINEQADTRLARAKAPKPRPEPKPKPQSSGKSPLSIGGKDMVPWVGAAILLVIVLVGINLRDDIADWFSADTDEQTVSGDEPLPLEIPPLARESAEPAPFVSQPPLPKIDLDAPESVAGLSDDVDMEAAPAGTEATSELADLIAEPAIVTEKPSVPEPEPVTEPVEKIIAEVKPTPVPVPKPVKPPAAVKPEVVAKPAPAPVPKPWTAPVVEKSESAAPRQAPKPVETATRPAEPVIAANRPAMPGVHGADWLRAQNPYHYTVQLLALRTEDAMLAYIRKHNLGGEVAYYQKLRNDKPWYSLLYGVYPDIDSAKAAVAEMPASIRPKQPWFRLIATVQAEIKK